MKTLRMPRPRPALGWARQSLRTPRLAGFVGMLDMYKTNTAAGLSLRRVCPREPGTARVIARPPSPASAAALTAGRL